MSSNTPPRAVLKGVSLSFGIITARVDLVPVQQSKATRATSNLSTTNLCPTCKDDVPLEHAMACPKGHGTFTSDEARKGVTVDGVLTPTTSEAVAEARAATVKAKTADLSVFHAEQVESATMPNGNMFRLRSEPTATYGLLLKLIEDRSLAFVCEMVVKGKTCLYRAVTQGGTIVLTELVRPERMHPFEPVEAEEIDERVLTNAHRLAQVMVEEFVPEDWADQRQARLKALAANTPEVESARDTDVKAATADLVAMLEAVKAA